MTKTLLLCTVGGSHQPILTAIEQLRPDFVVFFGTGPDPATGRPGSMFQIIGKGTPVEVRGGEGPQRLPNIPTLANLPENAFLAREVPADDLDGAVTIMRATIEELRLKHPNAVFVADYTGGTKTMTAALVLSAIETESVELQLVTGTRGDLVRVRDGSQVSVAVGVEGVRLRRAMAPFLAAWEHHNYAEAAAGLDRLRVPRDPGLRGNLLFARDLSHAFDAWDRFDHDKALKTLEDYRPRIGQHLGLLFLFLGMLVAPQDPRQEPARLWDLWFNAERKGIQARFDDAVARLYRLTEWTAQWLLRRRGIDTANLNPAQFPQDFDLRPTREGLYKAGLLDAWRLTAHHGDEEIAAFFRQEGERLRHHLLIRNASLLAHGATPIQRQDWEAFHHWVQQHLLPLIEREARLDGLRMRPPQLPRQLPQ